MTTAHPFLTVHPAIDAPRRSVADHVARHGGYPDLVRSGLIDDVLAGDFAAIEDPGAAVARLLDETGRTFDAVYVATGTCFWGLEDAVALNARIEPFLNPDGLVRVFTGKGCNTLCDAVILAAEQVRAGRLGAALVVNVEACGADLNRLQPYAFFSDLCLGVEVAAGRGDREILHARSGIAPYAPDRFSNHCDLSAPAGEGGDGTAPELLLLNCFDFVTRFKYGGAPLYRALRRPSFRVHHFGGDPFLTLREGGDAPSLIHVESPPRHVGQILVAPPATEPPT